MCVRAQHRGMHLIYSYSMQIRDKGYIDTTLSPLSRTSRPSPQLLEPTRQVPRFASPRPSYPLVAMLLGCSRSDLSGTCFFSLWKEEEGRRLGRAWPLSLEMSHYSFLAVGDLRAGWSAGRSHSAVSSLSSLLTPYERGRSEESYISSGCLENGRTRSFGCMTPAPCLPGHTTLYLTAYTLSVLYYA